MNVSMAGRNPAFQNQSGIPAALLLCVLTALTSLALATSASAQELKPFVKGSFAAIRAAHAGKPLIVHVWALACPPCLAELPEWGRLAAANPQVRFVLIEADQPRANAKPDPRAIERLRTAGLAGIENWAFADRFEDRLRFEIDPDWQGELPRTFLFTRDGTQSAFSGSFDPATLNHWIASATSEAGVAPK